MLFALRLVVPVFAPIGEEPGWRGFALPRLQRRHSPLVATLMLGVVVAAWHLPLVFLSEENFEPVMLLATRGRDVLLHVAVQPHRWQRLHDDRRPCREGAVGATFIGNDGFAGAGETRFAVLYTAAWCAVAIVLMAFDRKMWRQPGRRAFDPLLAEST